MPDQAQLDVVINSIANTAGFATAKAELAAMGGGGFSPLGGGSVNFGGSLTREEQAMAAAQLSTYEKGAKGAATATRELTTEFNTGARAASALGSQGAEAAGRLGALGSVMGSGGMLGIGIGAAIIGLGGIYAMGKSMIDNADQQDAATKSLAQAYATLGEKVPNKEIGDFIDKNSRFISSIYDAEQGFASLARAGFNDTMQLRLMNDALDLSAAKGISLSQSVAILTASSTGMSRGLLDLGISQKEINAAMAKGSTEAEKYEALLELLEKRTKNNRSATSDLKQSQDQLSVTWQKMSNDNGPALAGMMADVVTATDNFLNLLRSSDWGGFSNVLVTIADGIHHVTSAIGDANQAVQNFLHTTGGNKAGVSPHRLPAPKTPTSSQLTRQLRSGTQIG